LKSKKTNNIIPENFIKNLFEITAGYLSADDFEKLIAAISSSAKSYLFDQSSQANLIRIIQSAHDKSYFLRDLISYELNRDAIITIAQNSNFFTDILVRNPEYFYYALSSKNETKQIVKNFYDISIKNSLSKFKSFESKVRILKSFKRKEILRIGIQDILFNASLQSTTENLSLMAKEICSSLFEMCLEQTLEKYSIQTPINDYCIIALGKLGGNELNYSSDIDLIIFFEENVQLSKSKTKKEILIEAVLLFIQTSTENNEDGFLFRIDFRLRPDGRNAPLCSSMTDYLNYYESRGEDWERQMLLKSSFVCGEEKLFEIFMNNLRPFIYPATFSISPIEQIKKLKINIEKKISDEQNIKLSPGGIRDIEFSVQALQLINGGKISELRQANTLEAILKLKKYNLLNNEEALTLSENYIFYRRIEHFLQLMNNRQTHTIPSDTLIRNKLSLFLGYNNFSELNKDLQLRAKKIISIRNSILGTDVELNNSNDLLETINFKDRKQAIRNIQFLREGVGVSGRRIFDKNSIEAFSKIENELFRLLKSSVNPDLTLSNFVKIINHTDIPSVWYNQLRDKNLFEAFITLCQYNQHAIDLLVTDETNKEAFLSGKFSDNILQAELNNFSIQHFLFILSAQFTLLLISAEEISNLIKKYIEQTIIELAQKVLGSKISKSKYFIASLGSFSTGEMTFTSDIDLLFNVKNIQKQRAAEKSFQNFLLKLKEALKPFNVDCRLRPEGKSSHLAWDLNASILYFSSRARIWELQAFTKINLVYGDFDSYTTFYDGIRNRIESETTDRIKSEMFLMYKKIISQSGLQFSKFDLKKSSGCLIDLEFIVQYLILTSPNYFKICSGKNLKKNFELLTDVIAKTKLEISLGMNYILLKELQILIQTMFNISNSKIPSAENELTLLEYFFSKSRSDNFKVVLDRITKENHQLFNLIFKGEN
jgi:glutamate-ammonia-ligase adenylyltransferase